MWVRWFDYVNAVMQVSVYLFNLLGVLGSSLPEPCIRRGVQFCLETKSDCVSQPSGTFKKFAVS